VKETGTARRDKMNELKTQYNISKIRKSTASHSDFALFEFLPKSQEHWDVCHKTWIICSKRKPTLKPNIISLIFKFSYFRKDTSLSTACWLTEEVPYFWMITSINYFPIVRSSEAHLWDNFSDKELDEVCNVSWCCGVLQNSIKSDECSIFWACLI
jgi:hypothetical protein